MRLFESRPRFSKLVSRFWSFAPFACLSAMAGSACNTYTPDLVGETGVGVDGEPEMPGPDIPAPGTEPDPVSPSVEPTPSAPIPSPEPDPEPAVGPAGGGSGGTPTVPDPVGGMGGLPVAPNGGSGSGGTPDTSGGSGGTPDTGEPEPGPSIPMPTPVTLIEDFEDGDNTLLAVGDRSGFWFSDGSTEGTITPFAVEDLSPANDSLPSSTRAVHVVASGYDAGSWALLGVELNSGDAYPAAADYRGIEFWARYGGGPEDDTFNLKLPTTSTMTDDDHFGVDVTLTETWTPYLIPFDETVLRQQGFGENQTFDPAELVSIHFSLASGHSGFDIWIDHIRFAEFPE